MASETIRPWFCWLLEAIPAPPFRSAMVIAAALGLAQAGAFLLDHALSSAPLGIDGGVVAHAVLFAAGTAYALWVGWFVIEGSERKVAALRPALRGSGAEVDRLVRNIASHPPRWIVAATVVGTIVPFALAILVPSENRHAAARLLMGSLTTSFVDLYYLASQMLFWLAIGPVLYVLITGLVRFWRLGRAVGDSRGQGRRAGAGAERHRG